MKKVLCSLFLLAVALIAFIACEKENIVIVAPDTDSSLIWHIDDVEYLDSITEYGKNGLISRKVWTYDEYGRIIEEQAYPSGGLSSSKTVWSYSEGGKKITVTNYKIENGSWTESLKSERTVVARNDTCVNYYRKESGRWVLTEQGEYRYDDGGSLVMSCGRIAGREDGLKTEYVYDSKGRCIQERRYSGWGDDWVLEGQTDRSFDEKGNLIYIKSQRLNVNTGVILGDSIMECSFDDMNRQTSYSLQKWDFVEASWVGLQKYSLAYDERGNVVENTIYAWNADTQQWQPKDKTAKSYDEEGRLTSDANYIWRDTVWVGLGNKYEKAYDTNGNLIFDAMYVWDNSENCWAFRSSTTNEFDSDGILTHSISKDGTDFQEFIWEDGIKIREKRDYSYVTGELLSASRWVAYVDEIGNDTLIVEYYWLREKWEEFERTRYTYDDSGNQNSNSVYQLQNGEWVMVNGFKYEVNREGNTLTRQKFVWDLFYKRWQETSVRDVLTYDDSGRIKIFLTQMKVWDNATDTHWEDDKRTEYSYDSYGNNIGFVYSYWYAIENRWIYGEKQEYAFDAAGNQTLEANYMFDNTNEIWLGGTKWTAEYDDHGNQTLLMTYQWGYQSGWTPSSKTVSIYNDEGRILDKVKFNMTYRDGVWDWQGDQRTIYMFDPDTKTNREYNLTFNFITQSWEGTRRETVTDAQGNVVQEIVYKWKDEQWVRNTETTYDSRGNELSYNSYQETQDGDSFIEITYSYDFKNRRIETVRSLNGVVVYSKNVYYSVHKDIKVIDGISF